MSVWLNRARFEAAAALTGRQAQGSARAPATDELRRSPPCRPPLVRRSLPLPPGATSPKLDAWSSCVFDPRVPTGPYDVAEGEVIGGKYRVEQVLGRGGMGVVVAAYHSQLDERVALKFLLPEALMNAEVVARFEREARAAVRIKSEHVVRVTDVGRLASGAPYMVMEYLDGEDLASLLRRAGPLPLDHAVDFVLQACVALADAHSVGIVHRDLKPGNLFCARRSDGHFVIKVLDFGISKLTDRTSGADGYNGSMTQTAAVMGSPYFMSPEQAQSARDVDARSDIWSLGVVLFQLYTGNVPFAGQSLPEVAIKIATQEAPSVLRYRPDAPPALDAVVRRCLEKARERRYSNVAELAAAMLPFASEEARPLVRRINGIFQTAGSRAAPMPRSGSAPQTSPTLAQLEPPALAGALAGASSDQGAASNGRAASSAQRGEVSAPGTNAPWSAPRAATKRSRTHVGGVALVTAVVLGVIGGGIALLRSRSVTRTVDAPVSSAAENSSEVKSSGSVAMRLSAAPAASESPTAIAAPPTASYASAATNAAAGPTPNASTISPTKASATISRSPSASFKRAEPSVPKAGAPAPSTAPAIRTTPRVAPSSAVSPSRTPSLRGNAAGI